MSLLTLSDLKSSIRTGNGWLKLVPSVKDKVGEIATNFCEVKSLLMDIWPLETLIKIKFPKPQITNLVCRNLFLLVWIC